MCLCDTLHHPHKSPLQVPGGQGTAGSPVTLWGLWDRGGLLVHLLVVGLEVGWEGRSAASAGPVDAGVGGAVVSFSPHGAHTYWGVCGHNTFPLLQQ